MPLSVVPEWIFTLPFQMQSVLLLAARGPDGIAKNHPCKRLVRIYRATVFKHARYGRLSSVEWSQKEGDTFSDRRALSVETTWHLVCSEFLASIDELPLHYVMHFVHGVEILGYKCPDRSERAKWNQLYQRFVDAFHLAPETEPELDKRLNDFGREEWDVKSRAAFNVLDVFKVGQPVFSEDDPQDVGRVMRIRSVVNNEHEIEVEWFFERFGVKHNEYGAYWTSQLSWDAERLGWIVGAGVLGRCDGG